MRPPSLCECKEAILPLTGIFLNFANEAVAKRVEGFDTEVKKQLSVDAWDGNMRKQKRGSAHGAMNRSSTLRKVLEYSAESTNPHSARRLHALRDGKAPSGDNLSSRRGTSIRLP